MNNLSSDAYFLIQELISEEIYGLKKCVINGTNGTNDQRNAAIERVKLLESASTQLERQINQR